MKDKDFARAELITRFFCTECGSELYTTYEDNNKIRGFREPGDETGARVRYNSISIHPCRSCIEKHTRPAKALAKAISQITGDNQ